MSTMFKSEAKQPNGMTAHELFLNGFHLSLSSETFSARRIALPENKQLKGLRREHEDWLIYWREGFLCRSAQRLAENNRGRPGHPTMQRTPTVYRVPD
jgi:hypothetical protein